MMKRLLVGLAGTTYTPVAIQRAVSLAQLHEAQITGVTLVNTNRDERPSLSGRESKQDQRMVILRSDIEQSVTDFEMACQSAHVKYRIVKESHDPFSQLVDLARYHDLMIFGLRSVFTYDFLAGDPQSLLIRLVGAGVRPLLAVSEDFRSISRVLIAYSGSMESAKAMKRFVQMRLWPDVHLKIFTFHPSDDKANELLRDAEDYCRGHDFNVCQESNPGDPNVLLLAAAALWRADMIVMGNSARSIMLRKVLGDTLLETIRHTKIPLFLAQ
jgi:nucleotide-binding universal stress UspA family protein